MGLTESWMGHVDAIRRLLSSGNLIFADTNE